MREMKTYCMAVVAAACLVTGCSKAQNQKEPSEQSGSSKNILIVYLSRTKNTKAVAEIIHRNVGGTMTELETQNPYPENYKAIVDQVQRENESGYLPTLRTKIDIQKYDVVFIGFPTWGMQLPPPMKSFLSQYDLGGKTIIPFNTNAGYGVGSSFDKVRELCPKSKILEGFTTKGGIEREGVLFVMEGEKKIEVDKAIQQWLRKIGF